MVNEDAEVGRVTRVKTLLLEAAELIIKLMSPRHNPSAAVMTLWIRVDFHRVAVAARCVPVVSSQSRPNARKAHFPVHARSHHYPKREVDWCGHEENIHGTMDEEHGNDKRRRVCTPLPYGKNQHKGRQAQNAASRQQFEIKIVRIHARIPPRGAEIFTVFQPVIVRTGAEGVIPKHSKCGGP